MNLRITPAAITLVFLATACAQSHTSKATPTPGPVVFVPRAAATPKPQIVARGAATTAPSPTPRARAGASPAPATPSATPAPLQATQAPIPSANTSPQVARAAAPNVALPPTVIEPPNAPPQILAVELSSPEVSGGEVVSGTVKTSSNVASVEARVGGQSRSLEKVDVGRFTMSYRVPTLPFFLHKTYLIQIIARNAAGVAVSTAVPITLR